MLTWLRRLMWLAALGGAAIAGYAVIQRRRHEELLTPEWPPFEPVPAGPLGEPTAEHHVPEPPGRSAASAATWVTPVDGTCPDGFPVKANVKSGIFHVPGGQFYERTNPDRCYASAAAAEADGYRASKS